MDWKKSLAKVGLAEEVEVEDKTPSATPASAPTVAANPTMPYTANVTSPAASDDAARIAKYDATAKATLEEVLQKASVKLIPELQNLLATLETAIPVQTVRYQTALKILTTKGATISAIVSEYDLYLGELEAKNRDFSKEVKDQFDARVGTKIKAVQDYDTQITANQSQIATLQQQIIDLTSKRAIEQGGIAEAQGKLELLQTRFNIVYSATKSNVDQQKTLVSEYGKGL